MSLRSIMFSGSLLVCASIFSQDFTLLPGVDFKLGTMGFGSWCDFNYDGNLDVFVAGFEQQNVSYGRMYKNNGNKTFTEILPQYFPNIIYGSCSWGDYDNNGTPDVIITGWKVGVPDIKITKIYKNLGNNRFSEIQTTLPQLHLSNVQWVDIDQDGLLDIFIQGFDAKDYHDIGIFRNKGLDQFEKINIDLGKLPGIRGNFFGLESEWSDFDLDGLPDLITANSTQDTFTYSFFKNLGNFQLEKIDAHLPSMNYVSMDVGDINQDGLTDLVYTGTTRDVLYNSDATAGVHVLLNQGNLIFKEDYSLNNIGVFCNKMILADLNNDGFLDFIDSGTGSNYDRMMIFINKKDGTFEPHNIGTYSGTLGGASIGDFDNDNDLDILQYAELYGTYTCFSTISQNMSPSYNQSPQPPDSIEIRFDKNDLYVNWSAAQDDSTPTNCMTYNLGLGTVLHPDSLVSAGVSIPEFKKSQPGNLNRNAFHFRELPSGSYTLSIQSVDNSFNTSAFSTPITFCFRETESHFTDTIKICTDDSLLLYVPGNYLDYKWNTGSKDSAIWIKDEGYYNVNLIHPDGCISSEKTYLHLADSFSIDLGKDIDKCNGESHLIKLPNYRELEWSNGQKDNSLNIHESDIYWVKITSGQCIVSDTIKVVFHDLPIADLGKDTTLYPEDTIILDAGNIYDSIVWSTGSTANELIIYGKDLVPSENYIWIKVLNEYGCSSSDTILITKLISSFNKGGTIDPDYLVFPNPFTEYITLITNSTVSTAYRIRITDLNGQVLKEQIIDEDSGYFIMELPDLPAGIYILYMIDGQKAVKSCKIRKE